jgi:hypothetical protein
MCGTEDAIGNLADDVGNELRGEGMYDGLGKSTKDAHRHEACVRHCYLATYKSCNNEYPGKASNP